MKKYNTRAIVLKKNNYQDSHRIFTLFTYEYGKIAALARGVRKISSKRSGNLDTLNLVSIKISESDNGFKHIDEVKTINSFKNIKNSLEKSTKAYYMAELILKSLEEDHRDISLFNLFEKALKILDKSICDDAIAVAYFELNLLRLLGYQIPKFNPVIADLEKGRINVVTTEDAKKVDAQIKSFIYEYLSDRFKSLEL